MRLSKKNFKGVRKLQDSLSLYAYMLEIYGQKQSREPICWDSLLCFAACNIWWEFNFCNTMHYSKAVQSAHSLAGLLLHSCRCLMHAGRMVWRRHDNSNNSSNKNETQDNSGAARR